MAAGSRCIFCRLLSRRPDGGPSAFASFTAPIFAESAELLAVSFLKWRECARPIRASDAFTDGRAAPSPLTCRVERERAEHRLSSPAGSHGSLAIIPLAFRFVQIPSEWAGRRARCPFRETPRKRTDPRHTIKDENLRRLAPGAATQVAPFGLRPGVFVHSRIRAQFVDGPPWRFRRFEPQRPQRKEKKKTFAPLASWRFQDSNRKATQVAPFGLRPGVRLRGRSRFRLHGRRARTGGRSANGPPGAVSTAIFEENRVQSTAPRQFCGVKLGDPGRHSTIFPSFCPVVVP